MRKLWAMKFVDIVPELNFIHLSDTKLQKKEILELWFL